MKFQLIKKEDGEWLAKIVTPEDVADQFNDYRISDLERSQSEETANAIPLINAYPNKVEYDEAELHEIWQGYDGKVWFNSINKLEDDPNISWEDFQYWIGKDKTRKAYEYIHPIIN